MQSQSWVFANRRRLLLALYFDFCLISAVLGLLWHFAYIYIPSLRELPLYAEIPLFLVIEFTMWSQLRWSPGASLLSIRFVAPADRLAPTAQGWDGLWEKAALVDGWVKSNENWFTLLMGTLMVNDASKAFVRWTMWKPPSPMFGLETSEFVSALDSVSTGVIELFLAWAILRLRFIAVPVGVLHSVVALVSTAMSWDLWDEWVVEYVTRRRTFQGLPVRQTEIEQMQALMPEWPLAFTGGMIVLFLLLAFPLWKARRRPPTYSDG